MTVTDLDIMPDDGNRYEIIEGEVFASRAPNLRHQGISGNLLVSIKNYLTQNPIGEIWATPGVIFSEISAVIPDLVYISNERMSAIASGERVTGAPDLAIEILSWGSENERRDRIFKSQLYAKYGVSEYWIVDPEKLAIEIYTLDKKNFKLLAAYGEGDEIMSNLLPGFRCKVRSIFSR